MNMDQVCILAVWFSNALLFLLLVFVLYKFSKSLKEYRELEEKKLMFSIEIKDGDFNLLDRLIEDNLAEYRVLKLESIEKLYINEETQTKMFEYILRKVMYQLSPVYKQKLSYIYNEDKLNEVITQKINMYILDYTIEVNGNIRNRE